MDYTRFIGEKTTCRNTFWDH